MARRVSMPTSIQGSDAMRGPRLIVPLVVLALAAGLPGVVRAQSQNCADVIARDPQLSRATQAMSRTGILDNLRGVGPFTIFAVTDEGIARQPENLGALLFPQEGSARGGPSMDPVLAPSVVNAHIVDGRYPIESLHPGQVLRSRSGGSIEVVSGGNGPVILRAGPGGFSVGATPGDARIVQANIPCTGGVIHKIDHLLVR
jgi:uncharacterized surface protein with fasciclin (FAS1) repeats